MAKKEQRKKAEERKQDEIEERKNEQEEKDKEVKNDEEMKNEEQEKEDTDRSMFRKYMDMTHPPTCSPIQPQTMSKRERYKTRDLRE